jgi:tripartite-type tricarboxylate transporter receptor subunit TctC
MKLPRRQFLHQALVAAAAAVFTLTLSCSSAWSQTSGSIKLVVPSPPGGSTDILARLLAEQISRAQGRAMLIENRPGAATVIGTEAASRAAPDGNTLLVVTNPFLVNPLMRKLNYDPLKSFESICYLVRSPTVIVVNSGSPYHKLADLLNAARAKPGDLTMASVGPGSVTQIAFEILKRAADINMIFVPYPGSLPAINALLGEHVTSVFGNYSDAAEQINAGKLRVLATGSRTRIESLPDVPTIAESGSKDYEIDIWYGLFAPVKTPKETESQLAGWFTAALQVPEVAAKLIAQGLYPVGMCGADFGAFIRKQYDDYGEAIRESNIKAE